MNMEGVAQVGQIMGTTGQIPPAPIIVAAFKSHSGKIHMYMDRLGCYPELHAQCLELHVPPTVRSAGDFLMFMEIKITVRVQIRFRAVNNQYLPWLNSFILRGGNTVFTIALIIRKRPKWRKFSIFSVTFLI